MMYILIGLCLIGVILFLTFSKKNKVQKEQTSIGKIPNNSGEIVTTKEDVLTTKESTKDSITATEIILKNSLGNELVFGRPILKETHDKMYREVTLSNVNKISGHLINSTMPFLQEAITMNQIKKVAPNGLFTTLADPKTLSRFADDSYTTMVRDSSNNLVKNQGFTELTNISQANPINAITVGMQAMAAVSGQYYMHEINSKLELMSDILHELMNYHHDEKIGLLLTVQERLTVIVNKQYNDSHDIDEIRSLLKDVRNVYKEYHTRLLRQIDELGVFNSKALLAKDRILALEKKIQEINFTIKIAYEADQLSIQSQLSEIAIRMKTGDKYETVQELTEQMQQYYNSSFYSNIDVFIKEKYKPVAQNRYRKLGEKYLIKNRDHLKQINTSLRLSNFQSIDSNLGNLSQQLLIDNNKEQEILYIPNKDLSVQRVFVAV